MSHRRGGGMKDVGESGGGIVKEEMVPFQPKKSSVVGAMDRTGQSDIESNLDTTTVASSSLSLDIDIDTTTTTSGSTTTPASATGAASSASKNAKIKAWLESPYAAGYTEPTWADEYKKYKANPRRECGGSDRNATEGLPCICLTALVCGFFGAGRIGNMVVLKQTTEWVEQVEQDENDEGIMVDTKVTRFTRPRLQIVMGPYWPMLIFVTYPLILGLSGVTLMTAIPGKPPLIIFVWTVLTVGLIVALALTAFRDPGILPRYARPPPQDENGWRWNDRARSFRPRGAFYDPDTGVIVEGFDHTCPWTGTAIGKKNMPAFQFFVALVFICLMFDIVLLTNGIR